MRFFKIIVLSVLLTGCVKDYSRNKFDLQAIETAAAALLASSEADGFIAGVQLTDIPEQLTILNPEEVYLTDQGLYIQLDSFFVQASGLFVPRTHLVNSLENSTDPKYTRLSGNVFSYIISG